jgi:hypothetical protein
MDVLNSLFVKAELEGILQPLLPRVATELEIMHTARCTLAYHLISRDKISI